MGTLTITGCLRTSDNAIVFDTFPCGDYIEPGCERNPDVHLGGCVVTSGTHKGMIAVRPKRPNCTDTYYACLTGDKTFSVEVPDDCCYAPAECTPNCDLEGDENRTPYQLLLSFSGIQPCPNPCLQYRYYAWKYVPSYDYNGTFIVTQTNPNSPCYWSCNAVGTKGHLYIYDTTDCSNDPIQTYNLQLYISVDLGGSSGSFGVYAYLWEPNGEMCDIFAGRTSGINCTDFGTVENNWFSDPDCKRFGQPCALYTSCFKPKVCINGQCVVTPIW